MANPTRTSAGTSYRTTAKSRPNRVLLPVFCALLLAVVTANAVTPPDITVSLSRQTATIGDPVDLTFRLQYDTSLQLIAPVFGRSFGELEVLGDTVLAGGIVESGLKTYARRIRLVAFRPGSLWTPPVVGELVDSTGSVAQWQTDSLLLDIASVIGDADPESLDVKAIKGQYEMPESRWLYWVISGALISALLALWLWWRRRKTPEIAESILPSAPAWEQAIFALEHMPEEIDPDADGGRQWYFRLSEIFRRYLDDRFSWTSMDETTSQILRRLPGAPFAGGHRDRAREFLLLADQVRYARSPAITGRPEVDRAWIREFVESTIPTPVELASVTEGTPEESESDRRPEGIAA